MLIRQDTATAHMSRELTAEPGSTTASESGELKGVRGLEVSEKLCEHL